MTDARSDNRLAAETSPYLLQHKDNPVAWRAWGPDALAEAKRAEKPILLSVGYAACHWCHVMAHESFENPAIAARMNADFVNIKVDREERPDLDTIYQAALAMMGEQGGWPLTMFLTPDGEPFWGGTYFPPEARYGRPGFPDVLDAVARTYRADPDRVAKNVEALRDGLTRLSQPLAGDPVGPATQDDIAARILREVDMARGGIGGAPKFPQIPILKQLWAAWTRGDDKRFHDAVTVTCLNMCEGGIYDHLAGGFARYSVDDRWLVPHFEKMLYDNAQIVELLAEVWLGTGDDLYRERVEQTVAWLVAEMRTPEGAFAASLDADSQGEEGKYYVWSEAEIDAALGSDAFLFKRVYDVTPTGNWEGKTVLNRLGLASRPAPDEREILERCKEALLARRRQRVPPAKDDKVLADWNGLTIAALTQAGLAFDRPDWITLARGAFDFVVAHMHERGRLKHAWRLGRLAHAATLDDYAQMIRAALKLFQATGRAPFLRQAETWAGLVETHHGDSEAGGHFLTADDAGDVIARTKLAQDNATPSGAAVMAENLAVLWFLTGEGAYRDRADAAIRAFSGEAGRNFFPLSTLLGATRLLRDGTQIVIAGAQDDPRAQALARAAWEAPLPDRIVTRIDPEAGLPDTHPAAGKGLVGGAPAAYVCVGPVCSAPLVDPAALADRLRSGPA